MNALLKYYLKLFIFSADDTSYNRLEEKKKSILLTLFLYLFFGAISLFLLTNFYKHDYSSAIFNSVSLAIGILSYFLLKKKKNLLLSSVIFVAIISIISTFYFLTGGINESGIAFSLMLPLPVILIMGKKRGITILFLFFVINAIAYSFFTEAVWCPKYNLTLVCRLSVVFFFVAIMAFANEFVFEVLYQRLEKLSDTLNVSQQKYKNLAVNKEKFLSIISHDLSDHVGSFMSISTLLNEEYNDLSEQERQRLIKHLANVSKHNYKLLTDLLKWSTVQMENIPYQPKAFKLEKIYREVVELFHPSIEEKKLSIFLKMKSNSEIFADYHMASAILRNLVSNAIKYSNIGGEIRISAEEKEDKIVITVSDKGVGMSEQDLMRFNASLSFSNPGTMQEAGTGIGLILTKEFVQKNEGEMHVESQLGKGTDVTFTLPLVD